MNADELPEEDWDPKADEVQRDQRAAYDAMRERCPVAYSDFLGWTLFRHADVMRALHDPDTFSSVVSRHLSVPSGMDPPEHTDFRAALNPYFEPEQMAAFEPHCRQLARELAAALPADDEVELTGQFTSWFAVRVQCRFLGWPARFHEKLYQWVQKITRRRWPGTGRRWPGSPMNFRSTSRNCCRIGAASTPVPI